MIWLVAKVILLIFFAHEGANVIASDLSKKLIETAKSNSKEKILFYITPAHRAQFFERQYD